MISIEQPTCRKCGKECEALGDDLCLQCQSPKPCKICGRKTKNNLSIRAERKFVCTECVFLIQNSTPTP